ncbi:uncharacterized protein LOC134822752 isoform X2 [Bolinopsis microptera]|uniref:uncharacterized protein LOC134822752 isoform X2 n=1 Tax=Bolinopsis microptera TaxID=2820187 RepID=UPI00307AF41B
MEEEDECTLQYFSADVDNIDCPNWINFEEECYEDREADVRWFASLQPHLRTPECIIRSEQLESLETSPVLDISKTPNVKQRSRPKTMVNGKPPKLLSNKLQFSSSDDDEICEMLRAHNKRIQHKTIKLPASNESTKSALEQSKPKVENEKATFKDVPKIASKTAKRRSCAPLLMKNKSSKYTSGFPSSITLPGTVSESSKVNVVRVPDSSVISSQSNELKVSNSISESSKVNAARVPNSSVVSSQSNELKVSNSISESSKVNAVRVPHSSVVSPRSNELKVTDTIPESSKVNAVEIPLSSAISPQSFELKVSKHPKNSDPFENRVSKYSSSGKVFKPHSQFQPGAGNPRKPAPTKSSSSTVSKNPVVHKSVVQKPVLRNADKITSKSKAPGKNLSSQKNSAKPTKNTVASKPIIKSKAAASKRPQSSSSLANKVSSVSSKTQTSTKNPLPNKKVPPTKESGRMKPLRQTQNRSDGPFGASSNVMSIINSKTPGKGKLKSRASELKPRYSVETPSPPRTATCESSDDEDLDDFIRTRLKAHNAKVEAKKVSNNRVAGKSTKTGRQVSLHLGSPSKPKMKPVRHKD